MRQRTMTLVTPPTAPARSRPPRDTDVPADNDLPGSEEEVVAPRLVARLERVPVVRPAPAEEPAWPSVLALAAVAGLLGFGSFAATLLVGLAAVVGWAARAVG